MKLTIFKKKLGVKGDIQVSGGAYVIFILM